MARRQGRAVSLDQLRDEGLSRREISGAVKRGHLHIYHHRVYVVGTADLDPYGRLWAAHLAVGDDSLIASHSAGRLWAVRPYSGDVHVLVPTHRRHHRGVIVHHGTAERRRRRGLPLTSAARALLDMSLDLQPDALQIALNQGLAANAFRPRDVDAILAADPGHHGTRALSEALQAQRDDPGIGRTRSGRSPTVTPHSGSPPSRLSSSPSSASGSSSTRAHGTSSD